SVACPREAKKAWLVSKAHTNPADLTAAQPITLTGLPRKFPLPTIEHTDDHQINLRMLDRQDCVAADRVSCAARVRLTCFGALTMVRPVSAALQPGRVATWLHGRMSEGRPPDPLARLGERIDRARLERAHREPVVADRSALQQGLGFGFRIGIELVV